MMPSGSRHEYTRRPRLAHAFDPGRFQLGRDAFGIEVLDAHTEVIDLPGHRVSGGQTAVAALCRAQADESPVWKVERIGIPDDVAPRR